MTAKGRILITGGSGLIGRRLVAELAREGGWEVVVLSRRPERVRDLPGGARAVGWDGESPAGWGELVSGSRAVVHLAGENVGAGRWTAARKRALAASRLRSGAAVREAIAAAGARPEVLVQAGAVGYYGDRGDEVVTEESPPGDDFLSRLAVEWEAATAEVEALGVRRVVLRTGVVLAMAGGALPRLLAPAKLGLGGPLGSGEQYFPWIHEADETGALLWLLHLREARGPFNLTAPEPVPQKVLARELGRVLRRPAFLPAPAFALRLALGEMAQMVLTGQRAVPHRLLEMGYRFRFPRLGPALEDLLA
jgi:hypothetical protein